MQDNDLYVIAELRYQEVNPGLDVKDLYPLGWEDTSDYHTKIEIIAEAIQKGILIKDTDLYKTFVDSTHCRTSSINLDNNE